MNNEIKLVSGAMVMLALATSALVVLPYLQVRDTPPLPGLKPYGSAELRGREVYIANVVKCRPPGNRVPTPEESAACAPFLDRQIELVAPRIIVALGKTAATRLTGSESSLASLRGRMHAYRGIPLVITYHPAYLLRNLPDKAKAWEDLLFARRALAGA